MASYDEIQDWVKAKYGYTVKPCWIAHVKELSGLKPRVSPNRHDPNVRLYPCPEGKIEPIKSALKHFGMI